jgi:hypothetical protein
MLLLLGLLAAPVLAALAVMEWLDRHTNWIHYLLGSVLCLGVALACAVLLLRHRRIDRRERDIRLLLGTHPWGSSDPAYWHTDLLGDLADPYEVFGVDTFAELGRQSLASRNWGRAMWAARLCAAQEDVALGEELTSTILNEPEVQGKLREVRKEPLRRHMVFGDPEPFTSWVRADPELQVFQVTTF